MEQQSISEMQIQEIEIKSRLRADRNKYLLIIGGLIVVNTILFGFLIKGPRSTSENFISAINANLIGFNLLGFILGTLVALIPYRGLSYGKRYLRASLLTILTIDLMMTIGLILIGFMTLLGWY